MKGWPSSKDGIYNELCPYWNIRNELHVIDSLIFKQNTIVIPQSMRKEMLSRIHEGHFGVNYSCNRAKEVVYWPNMVSQITDMCKSCYTCQIHQPNNSKENIRFHEVPDLPWIKIGCDLFEFNRQHYLLLVDYYSKFVEISKLENISAITVITHMKSIFSRHGIPRQIICDSGSQFTSKDFQDFAKFYEFDFTCSSPYYHQSNGLAESQVKIIKNLLKKAQVDGSDPYLALLNFRNTPKNNAPSPAQLLFSRTLRTRLPTTNNVLKPTVYSRDSYLDTKCQDRIRRNYNNNARDLEGLAVGKDILFKKGPNPKAPWVQGKIINKNEKYRSYTVQDDNKNQFNRNRFHLRVFNNPNTSPHTRTEDKSPSPNNNTQIMQTPCTTGQLPHRFMDGVPSFEGYRTSRGRIIRAPKRLIFD